MNFDPILYGPLFVRDAPDVNLVASGTDPVEVTVAAGGSSWTLPVTPVLKNGSYVAPLRMREILSSVVDIPGLAAAGVREVPLVTLSAGGASMSFRSVYGSAAGRTPTQLAGHWLTWRDQISKTQAWGRERLTFLAGRDLLGWQSGTYTVRAKVFFASGDPETVTLASGTLQADCRYVTVDASYAAIAAAVQSAGTITAWDVSYSFSGRNSSGAASVDGYPLRLVLARRDVRVKEFIFCNSFGVEDRVYSSGRSNPKVDGASVAFLSGGTERELRNDAEEGKEVYSGHISSARDGALWTDFLKAKDRHILLSGALEQIVVDSHETDLQDNAIGSVKFTYHLAKLDAGRYFDDAAGLGDYDPGQRYGALFVGDDPAAEDLPSEDLFFLKTRLDEFPAADLTEELLFLVQNPLTQVWGNAPLSALKDWLQEAISARQTPVWNGPWADYSAGVADHALAASLGRDLYDRIRNIEQNPYALPVASDTVLGGIRVGANLSIDAAGVLSAVDTTYGAGTGLDLANGVFSLTQAVLASLALADSALQSTDLKALTLKVGSATVGSYTPTAAKTLTVTAQHIYNAIGDTKYHKYGGDTDLDTFKIGGATLTWHAATANTPAYLELDSAFLTAGDQIISSGTPGSGGSGGGAGYLYELGDTLHDATHIKQSDGTTNAAAGDLFAFNGTAWYALKLGSNLSVTGGILNAADTTYGAATQSVAGLMSAADKTKLDGIAEGANNYSHPTGGANTTISAASGKVLSAITVNSLGHVTSVSSKTLAAADIPNLSWSKITSGKPTTLDGYGITDASIADGVITLGGNTITPVTEVKVSAAEGHTTQLEVVKGGISSYITVPFATSATTASKLSTVSKTAWGQTYWTSGGVPTNISGNMSSVGNITPSATGTKNLGSASLYWNYAYTKRIYLASDAYIEYNGDGYVYISKPLVTEGDQIISSGTPGSGGSGGGAGYLYELGDTLHDATHIKQSDGTTNAAAGDLFAFNGTAWYALKLGTNLAISSGTLNATNTEYSAGAGSTANSDTTNRVWSASALNSFISTQGYTKNAGTVTSVKVGTTSYSPSSGVVSLPAYPTTLPASDVYSWAKASTKPSYTFSEIVSTPTTLSGYGITDWVVKADSSTALDSLTTAGVYRLGTQTSPNNVGYGNLLVIRNGSTSDTLAQMYFAYTEDKVYFRRGQTSSFTLNSWRQLYHTGNLSLATLAGSTQIGSESNPVYYSGSALTACGNYFELLYGGKQLTSSDDLNSITNVGTYYANSNTVATTEHHYPVASVAGRLFVSRPNNGSYYLQEYVSILGRKHARVSTDSGSTWSGWTDFGRFATGTALGSSTVPIYWDGEKTVACDLSTTYAPYNAAGYLPLNGGHLTGNLYFDNSYILFRQGDPIANVGYINVSASNELRFYDMTSWRTVWHSGNAGTGYAWGCTTLTATGNITTTGNVGIGTSGPAGKLDVYGGDVWISNTASSGGANLYLTGITRNANNGTIYFMDTYTGSSPRNGFKIASEYTASGSRQDLVFYSSNNATSPYTPTWSESMRITYDGKVGIGKSSPGYALDVAGHARVKSLVRFKDKDDSGEAGYIGRAGSASNDIYINATTAAGILFWTNSTQRMSIDSTGLVSISNGTTITRDTTTATNAILALVNNNYASASYCYATTSTASSLIANGRLIHVTGKALSNKNSAYFGYHHVADGSNSNFATIGLFGANELLNIMADGKVGIGTTAPSYQLHVVGKVYASTGIVAENNIGIFGIDAQTTERSILNLNANNHLTIGNGLKDQSSGGGLYLRGVEAHIQTCALAGSYADRVVVDSSGNVGIGTSSPSEMLHIVGTTPFIRIGASSNANQHAGGILFQNGVYNGFKIVSQFKASYSRQNLVFYSSNDTSGSATWEVAMLIGYDKNITMGGSLTTAGDQVVSSDATLKTNLQDVTYSVADIAKARAVSFDWKDGRGHSVGSIAQDWKPICPELVHGEEGNMTLAYGQLALVNTILLARQSESHEERIKALEAENMELRREIERLRMN